MMRSRAAICGWCLTLWLSWTGAAAVAGSDAEVQGLVHSARYAAQAQGDRSYHLMLLLDPAVAAQLPADVLRAQIRTLLGKAGYQQHRDDLLAAAQVIVVRAGVEPDRPSVDDILLQSAEPDALLPTGLRFVQLEAYDVARYTAFLRAQPQAAADVNLQFQRWRTVVQSRGLISDYARVLPALLRVADAKMASQMPAVEPFTQPLAGG